MKDIRQFVRRFILDNCMPGEPDSALGDDDLVRENGVLDSTNLLSLVNFIEHEFGIEIASHHTSQFQSVDTIVSIAEQLVVNKAK
jgi:acyl carrier protein